jgi:hypothetical protein
VTNIKTVFIPSASQSIYAHNIEVEETCEGTNCGLTASKRFNFIGERRAD